MDLRGALEPRPELAGPGVEPRRSEAGIVRYSASRSSWWRKSYSPRTPGGIEDELVDELLERRLESVRAARP